MDINTANTIQFGMEEPGRTQSVGSSMPQPRAGEAADIDVQTEYAAAVARALSLDTREAEAVAAARQAIADGTLDTEANALAAAEFLLKQGV